MKRGLRRVGLGKNFLREEEACELDRCDCFGFLRDEEAGDGEVGCTCLLRDGEGVMTMEGVRSRVLRAGESSNGEVVKPGTLARREFHSSAEGVLRSTGVSRLWMEAC